MIRILFPFLIAALFHSAALAQKLPAFVSDSLDAYIERSMKQFDLPGMAVAIVKDGKIVVAKGYGVREIGKPEKVDANSLFMIASCSKAFTATSLCMLQQEKKLSLDKKASAYVPGFRLKDSLASREVTLRDLLCHRIGLETFQGDFVHWNSKLTRKGIVQQLEKYEAPYSFRAQFGYCNAAFTAAGMAIASATNGVNWDQFVKEKFFDPLGMTRSSTTHAVISSDANACRPHTRIGGKEKTFPYDNIDNLGPAASINSCVNDLAKWLQLQLDSGRYGGKQIVPFEALQETRTAHTIVNDLNPKFFPSKHFSAYGLGWFLADYSGRKIIWHDGGAGGFLSNVTIVPEERLGFVILTNSDNNAMYEALHYQLLDAFFGQPYRNYSATYHKRQERKEKRDEEELKRHKELVAKKNTPPLPLKDFAGVYVNEAYGKMILKEENGKLLMGMEHHPHIGAVLEFREANTFLCTYNNPVFGIRVFPFEIKNEKVISFNASVNDFLDFMPYTFTKQ